MTKIIYRRNKCIGCTTCSVYDPNHFEMSNDTGKAELKNSTCDNETCTADIQDGQETAKLAEENCPTTAIEVKE
ncbi:MAG: ferredoxin [Candidatus Magasanikbacteria bacterium]